MASSDKKSTRQKKSKDGQLVIRINKKDRDAFLDKCADLDTTAAREIRRFIRSFMVKASTH